jgi:hypothetical protein
MEKQDKRVAWVAGLLSLASALGIAYLWNPKGFEDKVKVISDTAKDLKDKAKKKLKGEKP